jgi:hypothetical protein
MPPSTEVCELCARAVERRFDANDEAHRAIDEAIGEVAAEQTRVAIVVGRIDTKLDHVAAHRPAPWYKPVLLAAGLTMIGGALGFGGHTLFDHASRLTALESAAHVAQTTTKAARAGDR